MARCAEGDRLGRGLRVWVDIVVGRDQPVDVDQNRSLRRLARSLAYSHCRCASRYGSCPRGMMPRRDRMDKERPYLLAWRTSTGRHGLACAGRRDHCVRGQPAPAL